MYDRRKGSKRRQTVAVFITTRLKLWLRCQVAQQERIQEQSTAKSNGLLSFSAEHVHTSKTAHTATVEKLPEGLRQPHVLSFRHLQPIVNQK